MATRHPKPQTVHGDNHLGPAVWVEGIEITIVFFGFRVVYVVFRGVYLISFAQSPSLALNKPLASECGTYKTVKTRFWAWL